MNEILKVNNLTKYFGKFKALDDINFSLSKGEILGFIGPNGAGKSTTIRAILGILKASSGSISIFELDSWNNSVEIHNNLAYVPGDVNLWPNLTGGEIIDVFLKLKNQERTQKTEELIKKFDLDTSKKARAYSKGNRQKVALIAALSSDVDLYIFDEPTSGLDPLMEQVFQECVLALKKQGKSILLSSHILSEVEKLCDRVTIIKDGQIIESGTLAQMRHLTRTHLQVVTKKTVLDFEKLDGIYNLVQGDKTIDVQVDTERIGTIIEYLSKYDIASLTSMPPTLEDLFMRFYDSKEVGQNND